MARLAQLFRTTWLALGVFFAALACRGSGSHTFEDLDQARALTREVRVLLSQESDAGNRAVMAETDEASQKYASEAAAASRALERQQRALGAILQRLGISDEQATLTAFGHELRAYQQVEGDILRLAVENTNLKAQRLSFGPARDAAEALRSALAAGSVPDDWHGRALADDVLLSVREIQALHAPHIAERDDAAMARLETRMAELSRRAHAVLDELVKLDGKPRPEAISALARFEAVSAQIIELSRKNTNLRSLDLALATKPGLVAACDLRLRELSDRLAKAGGSAAR